MFASVGADGSVRMFDLRHLEHSTIIYEDPQHHPLLRLCWNKQDPNYLATMAMDGMEVRPHPRPRIQTEAAVSRRDSLNYILASACLLPTLLTCVCVCM